LHPLVQPIAERYAEKPVHGANGANPERARRSPSDHIRVIAMSVNDRGSQATDERTERTILSQIAAGRNRNRGNGNPKCLQSCNERVISRFSRRHDCGNMDPSLSLPRGEHRNYALHPTLSSWSEDVKHANPVAGV
jgi:hypothetical protein